MNHCVSTELNTPSKKFGNIAFSDRTRKCLAKMKDTHLQLKNQAFLPYIYLGLNFISTSDGLLLANKNEILLKKNLSSEVLKKLKPGIKVLSIDGTSPSDFIKKFLPYISSSSPEYADVIATRSATYRNFLYPDKNFVTVRFEGLDQALKLKWWSASNNVRQDTRELFKKLQIPSVDQIQRRLSYKIRKGIDTVGYHETTPIYQKGLVEFLGDDRQVGLRIAENDQLCYIQLLTFNTKRWFLKRKSSNFLKPLGTTIQRCNRNQKPLILDLRSNVGGDPNKTSQLFSLLTEPDKAYPGFFFTGRLTKHLKDILYKYSQFEGLNLKNDFAAFYKRYLVLKKFENHHPDYLPPVPNFNIKAHKKFGGFAQPIITLISPRCLSACDIMANFLHSSGRALLVGSQTNGTGAAFLEIGDQPRHPKAEWVDSVYGTFTLKIMNTLLGVGQELVSDETLYLPFASHFSVLRENKPIAADNRFRRTTSKDDVIQRNVGWKELIENALKETKKKPIP